MSPPPATDPLPPTGPLPHSTLTTPYLNRAPLPCLRAAWPCSPCGPAAAPSRLVADAYLHYSHAAALVARNGRWRHVAVRRLRPIRSACPAIGQRPRPAIPAVVG